ncbi:MAG: hypothetical protein DYG89_45955 [Caldilinea sp. CFX5]|nr:hypothetical protein [Caldilinea sp. CFX5]
MTTSFPAPAATAPKPAPTQESAAEAAAQRSGQRWLWGIVAVVLLFVGAFTLAWYNANQLTARFMADAEASYAAGNYLDALVGYQTFDAATNQYVNHGGYLAVEKIWSNPYSWPQPAAVVQAQARSQEIIDQRLTIKEAEQYIQANIGKPAPYFAEIYLRLGELYEAAGQISDARAIYESIPRLFTDRPDLSARAQAHLADLPAE